MTLSQQVASLENECAAQKAELERARAQVHRQEGAIREGRSERLDLLNKIDKLTARCGYLEQHFHTIHGSAEHLAREQKEIAALFHPPVEQPTKKMSLLDQLGLRKERAHETAQVVDGRADTGSVRAENGNAG